MRSRLLVAALIVSATALCGCLEQERVLKVRPDGSGTLTETTLLGAQMVQMMTAMGGAMPATPGGEAPKDPLQMMVDKKTLAKQAAEMGEGVTVASAKPLKTEDGRAGGKVVYAFQDVSKLKLSMQQDSAKGSGGPGGMGGPGAPGPVEKKKKEVVKFQFVKAAAGRPAKLTIIMPEPPKAPKGPEAPAEGAPPEMPPEMKAQMTAQMKGMMKQMFGGMRMSLVVKTGGKVVKTNATHPLKDGTGVTVFDMNFGKLVQDEAAFEKMQTMDKDMTLEEAKKAFDDPMLKKYIKIETNPKIEIQFK